MAGFQNFTPRTANLAEVWKGFNPAANFLGSMKTMRQMGLDEAEEARLQESAEVDRMVKETLLPLQVEESRAKIGLTLAQRDYAASRASRAADEASALSVFERSPNDRSQILRILGLDDDEVVSPEIRSGGGGGASILNATPSSGGGFESFDLSASNTKNPIVAEFSPKEEETGPLYNLSENKTLLASSDPFGVPDTGGQTNLKSLTTASALTPKGPTMRNAADWDEDNTNFSPLEKKNPLTSLEIPEDKRKEIERLNDETGALNKNQDQAAPTSEEDIGAYLVKGLNKLEKAKDRAQLAKGPEKRFVSGLTLKLEDLTYREAAKKLGIDPDMGESAVKALTRSGNGMRRSPSQINQIVELVKGGMDITEASIFFDAKSRKELENKLNGKTAGDDTIKVVNEINTALKSVSDESGAALPGKEAEYENLQSRKDVALQLPTGISAYSDRYGRMSERADKLQRAMDTGVALGGVTKDQLPQEIARLNQEQVAIAAEKAPYFKDRESLAKWLSDSNTRNLPYFTEINGTRSLARYNGVDPNTPQVWSPTQSMWVNFSSPEPQPTPEKSQSEFSKAGQTGQKIRKAGGGLVRAVKGASTTVGEKISNIPAGVINAGASIAEAGAGVFNVPLKIPRASSISESLGKMGLKKYEDGTWGPIKQ